MAVPYHTHTFELPAASKQDVVAGVVSDKVVVPSSLGSAAVEDVAAFATAAQGAKADKAIDADRVIKAGSGLKGGGDLSADRTLALSDDAMAALEKARKATTTDRKINAGSGLSGGGDLTQDVTVDLSQDTLLALDKAKNSASKNIIITTGEGLTGGGPLWGQNIVLSMAPSYRIAYSLANTAVQPEDLGKLAKKNAIAIADIAASGSANNRTVLYGDGAWREAPSGGGGSSSGDMWCAVYDPKNRNSDAFLMDNMTEGTVNKLFSAAEKSKLSGLPANAIAATRAIYAGSGLSGGGDLTANRTISLSDASHAALVKAGTAVQPGDLGTAAKENREAFASRAQGIKADEAFPAAQARELATKDKVTVREISAAGTPSNQTYLRGDGWWASIPSGSGTGDMDASVYDPSGKKADAFNMDNMVEGTKAKIYTDADKSKLANSASKNIIISPGEGLTGGGPLWGQNIMIAMAPSYLEAIKLARRAVQPENLGVLAKKNDVGVSEIAATGNAGNKTFLRGDGVWATLPNTDGGGSVPAVVAQSFHNWIINGGFTIAQRRPIPSTRIGDFGYDRWLNTAVGRQQYVEALPAGKFALYWNGGGNGTLGNKTGTSPIIADLQSGNTKVVVPNNAENVCLILVRGEVPADNPFEPRPFDQELCACKRYYQKSHPYEYIAQGSTLTPLLIPYLESKYPVEFSVRFEKEMAAPPVVTVFSLSGSGGGAVSVIQGGGSIRKNASAKLITAKQFCIDVKADSTPESPIEAIAFHFDAVAEIMG